MTQLDRAMAVVPPEALLRLAVDSLRSHAFFTLNPEGIITSWNVGAERLFGFPRASAEAQHVSLLFPSMASVSEAMTTELVSPERPPGIRRRCQARRRDGTCLDLVVAVAAVRLDGRHLGYSLLAYEAAAEADSDSAQHTSRAVTLAEESASKLRESSALLTTEIADRTQADAARLRLLRRLVVVQEEERRRIARDLHDDLGQRLIALRLTLEPLREGADQTGESAEKLAAAMAMLEGIDEALDFLAWELKPAALDESGLADVLESYVTEWSCHSGVAARFHSQLSDAQRLAPEIEATVYRIAQEALNNVAKHAKASTVNVIVEPRGEHLALIVEDDGVGLPSDEMGDKMMGLSTMRERAAAVGGTLEFEPTPHGGTTVLAHIPMATVSRPSAGDGRSSEPEAGSLIANNGAQSTDTVLNSLRSRLQELQEAVGARDEFIATVAHELRNPISPLVFQVRLALGKTERISSSGELLSVDWVQSQLRGIEQRLHRLLETLDRLLDVSRLATGRMDLQFEAVDLAEVVQEVLSTFEAELGFARCTVTLSTRGETNGLWDRMRLEQICRNLLSNAIRFGAGQPITIIVEGNEEASTLTVRDRGVGIAPQLQKRVFERFERGMPQRSGGFGIGLWVVKSICMAMGGTIVVESEMGEGALFTVTLPRRAGGNEPGIGKSTRMPA